MTGEHHPLARPATGVVGDSIQAEPTVGVVNARPNQTVRWTTTGSSTTPDLGPDHGGRSIG
jgi:hypothetical protein